MTDSKNEPVARIRLSVIHASIWRNQRPDGNAYYSTTFERRYLDRDGNWKGGNSYTGEELLLLAKVADLAHTEVLKLRAADRPAASETEVSTEAA